MKRFFKQIILFIIVPVSYLTVNYIINQYFIKTNIVKVDANILIAGDSHTQFAIDPSHFHKAKNISQPAEPYVITFYKIKNICSENRIDTLILGFSYHNISTINDYTLKNEKSKEMFNRIYSIAKYSEITILEINKLNYFRAYIRHMCLYPIQNHNYYIGSFAKGSIKKFKRNSDLVIETHFFHNGENAGISNITVNYLDSIIKFTNRNKIKLVLVTTPLHRSYSEKIPENFIIYFNKMQVLLRNKDILTLDMSETLKKEELFLDVGHLNYNGSQNFTEMLINKINNNENLHLR